MKKALWVGVTLFSLLDGATIVTADDAPGTAAAGSDELKEIIVTAERRTSDVQKTPVSITVRGGTDLQEQGRYSLQQILEDVPGVSGGASTGVSGGGSDTAGTGITIRGVQSNGGASGQILTSVPTTAVYTDGVYEGVGGTYDIDHVEVLRGPQGTLYGRSATSGVVATYTRNPELEKFGGDVAVEFGNYNLLHYTGALNLPIGDTLAVRISANEYKREGYYSKDGGALKSTDARIKVLYQPIEDLSVLFGVAMEDNQTHSGGTVGNIVSPGQINYSSVVVDPGKNIFRQYWANINWNFGLATLTYEPAFRSWYQNAPVYATGPGGGALAQNEYTPFDQFVTHELRVASNADSKIKWLLGTFWYDNRLRDSNVIDWQSSGGLLASAVARKETKDWGIFAQGTVPILDTTRLTAGLRYDYTYVQTLETYTTNVNLFCNTALYMNSPASATCLPGGINSPQAGLPENDSSLTIGGQAATRRFYDTTFMARLEHDLTPTSLVYGSISTGFLPGDVQISTGSGNLPVSTPYAEETLTSYELGSKNRFMNNSLQLNADVFYYRYGGYQTLVTPNPLNPGSQELLTVPARMMGTEIEAQWLATPDDRLSASYAYIDAYYVNRSAAFLAAVEQSHITNVTPHTLNVAYDHDFHLPDGSILTPHGDARMLSAHDISAVSPSLYAEGGEPYVQVGTQAIGDVSLGWTSSDHKYTATGYVRNVADKRYLTVVLLQSVNPLSATGNQYDPRTFGVILSAKF